MNNVYMLKALNDQIEKVNFFVSLDCYIESIRRYLFSLDILIPKIIHCNGKFNIEIMKLTELCINRNDKLTRVSQLIDKYRLKYETQFVVEENKFMLTRQGFDKCIIMESRMSYKSYGSNCGNSYKCGNASNCGNSYKCGNASIYGLKIGGCNTKSCSTKTRRSTTGREIIMADIPEFDYLLKIECILWSYCAIEKILNIDASWDTINVFGTMTFDQLNIVLMQKKCSIPEYINHVKKHVNYKIDIVLWKLLQLLYDNHERFAVSVTQLNIYCKERIDVLNSMIENDELVYDLDYIQNGSILLFRPHIFKAQLLHTNHVSQFFYMEEVLVNYYRYERLFYDTYRLKGCK